MGWYFEGMARGFLKRYCDGAELGEEELKEWRSIFSNNKYFLRERLLNHQEYYRYLVTEKQIEREEASELLDLTEDATCRSLLIEFIGGSGDYGASAFDDLEL